MAGKKVRELCFPIRILVLFPIILMCALASPSRIQSLDEQTSESFYLKLLNQGEQSFLAGEYQRAIRELEIAAFGLFRQKVQMGKAYVYMTLCYQHLEDSEKAKASLIEAFRWLTEEEYKALNIQVSASDIFVLEQIIEEAGLFDGAIRDEDPELEEDVSEKPEKKKKPDSVQDRISQLVTERKQQQSEEVKEKPPVPIKKENPIEGLEELFEEEESPKNQVVSEIWIHKEESSLRVDILFQPYTAHRVFEIINPPPKRIVIDIQNITGINAADRIPINDFGIQVIRTGMYNDATARIVFDTVSEIPIYKVEKTEDGLRIVFQMLNN